MTIETSGLEDIQEIFRLYKLATDYQKIKFRGNIWPAFEQDLIKTEIKENRQFKIIIDGQISCVWAITFNDAQIWEEKDKNDSIFIHRIATNPDFRGHHFVKIIVEWAKNYTKENSRKFVRMDTCGQNDQLINHYKNCGFDFLGMKKLQNFSELPSHYHNADVCFFEIELK